MSLLYKRFVALFLAVALVASLPTGSLATNEGHIYTRTELAGLSKEDVIAIAMELQQRALLADPEFKASIAASAPADLVLSSATPTVSRHHSALITTAVALAMVGGMILLSHRNMKGAEQESGLSSVARRRFVSASSSTSAVSNEPIQLPSTCNTLEYLNAIYSASSGVIFPEAKNGGAYQGPPSPTPTPQPSGSGPQITSREQRAIQEGVSAALGTATQALSCGISEKPTLMVSANSNSTTGFRSRNLPASMSAITTSSAPGPQQAFCNTVNYTGGLWTGLGKDLLNTQSYPQDVADTAIGAILKGAPAAFNCNALNSSAATSP